MTDKWKLQFARVSHLDDLALLHLSDVTHEYPRHVHEEFCIAIILGGSETHICRGQSHTAFPGDLLLIQAEDAHASKSVAAEYKSIQFKPRLFERLAGRRMPSITDPIVSDPRLFRAFVDLYSTLSESNSRLEQESQFVATIESLVNYICEDDDQVNAEPRSITKVRDHLRSHYSENVALAELATIADLSPYHLVRVFNDQVGVPPHEYQTQIRITNAQRLLRNGRSISDAAIETGFFDQSHFTRNFKRITGLTPGKYLHHSNIVQDN